MKKSVLLISLLGLAACASKSVSENDYRAPATVGVGDVGSSTDGAVTPAEAIESYKLPITRNGQSNTRVAYNFWSGEYPSPIVDINAHKKGMTTIQGFASLRNPVEKKSCTVKNGLYHPWATNDNSLINYYTLTSIRDFEVKKDLVHHDGEYKLRIPQGALITNVVYYAENYCGSTLKIGKTLISFSAGCPFFLENPDLAALNKDDDYSEQWLYLKCEEKDNGKIRKIFVKDQDLMSQPGVLEGRIIEYGKVGRAVR